MRSSIGPVVVAATLTVGGLVVGACSSGSDTAAEKIAEATTGGDVEIGEDGDVSISTPEGKMDISSGQELPADFPDDVPVPDGSIDSLTTTAGGAGSGPSYLFALRTDASVPALTEQLSADFVAQGWTESMKTTAADGALLSYTRDDGRTVTVTLGEDTSGGAGSAAQYVVVSPAP